MCGNVRSCYKGPAVKQVLKIPTVLIERGIPYAQIRSPPLLLSFQHVGLKAQYHDFWRSIYVFLSDIDECNETYAVKRNKCHLNASCINMQGSYNCSCNPNYVGDGFNCEGAFDLFHDSQFVEAGLG